MKVISTIGFNAIPTAFPDVEYWVITQPGVFSAAYRSGYVKKHHKLIVTPDVHQELKTSWFKDYNCDEDRKYLVKPYYVINEDF